MFGLVNRNALKQYENMSGQLEKTREVNQEQLSILGRKKSDISSEIARLQKDQPENTELIAQKDKELKQVEKSIGRYEDLNKGVDKVYNAMQKSGDTVNDEVRTAKLELDAAKLRQQAAEKIPIGASKVSTPVGVAPGSRKLQMGSPVKRAKGGLIPGSNSAGDKIPIMANSGEGVLTKPQMKLLTNLPDLDIRPVNDLAAAIQSLKLGGTQQTSKVINDNRVINIVVNQNDRKAVEQVVLNAIYSDKM
jgi:hypothetical protein